MPKKSIVEFWPIYQLLICIDQNVPTAHPFLRIKLVPHGREQLKLVTPTERFGFGKKRGGRTEGRGGEHIYSIGGAGGEEEGEEGKG